MTIAEKMRDRYGKAAYDASLPIGADVVQVIGSGTVSMWSRLSEDDRERWRKIGEAAVNSSHGVSDFSNCKGQFPAIPASQLGEVLGCDYLDFGKPRA